MIQKIITAQEEKLREKTKSVTRLDKKVLQIIRDMEETLKVQTDPEGVGIAAPQVGLPLKLFILNHRGKHLVVANPEIKKISKKTNDPEKEVGKDGENQYIMEGCLSLPHFYGPVKRSWEIEVCYDTPEETDGKWLLVKKNEKFKGFIAQIIQHEIDHLNGKLFIDRLFEQNRSLYQLKNNEWHEVDLP